MSLNMIHVRPGRAQRQAFARWAVQQSPKVRTSSPHTFAVPHRLFTAVPEELLTGAHIDGHLYVPPDDDPTGDTDHDRGDGGDGGDGGESVGEGQPDATLREATPGSALPEADPDAYGPDAVALPPPEPPEPPEPAARDADGEQPAGHVCDTCGRDYASARGLSAHQRKKHPDESPG